MKTIQLKQTLCVAPVLRE